MIHFVRLSFVCCLATVVIAPELAPFRHEVKAEMVDKAIDFRSEDSTTLTNWANEILKWADKNPFSSPSQHIQSNHPTIQKLAQDITKGLNTDLDKSKAIYKWVATHISYDTVSVYYDPFRSYQSDLEVLTDKKTMCMGFSRLNASLHRAVGIEAKIVYGDNHAWNEIFINGMWQSQDPTYGSGYINANTRQFVAKYKEEYFSKTDITIQEGEFLW